MKLGFIMTSEEMLKEIAALPTGARREIEDFVARLAKRYRESSRSSALGSIASDSLLGILKEPYDDAESTASVQT